MSLQELNEAGQALVERYHEPNMGHIIDDYCEEIISTKIPKTIADMYVVDADAQRYYRHELDQFNTEHIYTGLMNNKDAFNMFDNWYRANYLTYEDTHDHYAEVFDCLAKNIDPRMEVAVICELIANGTKNYDEESVRYTFSKIDQDEKNRNRSVQIDENGNRYFDATPPKEFQKAIVRTCYKLARDFDSISLAQYISRDLYVSYNKPVNEYFYLGDDRTMKVSGYNNMNVISSLREALQNAINYLNDGLLWDDDFFYDMFDSMDCDVEILDNANEFQDADNIQDTDLFKTKDNDKSL